MCEGFLLRTADYAYIKYGEDAAKGIELFDVRVDPGTNPESYHRSRPRRDGYGIPRTDDRQNARVAMQRS